MIKNILFVETGQYGGGSFNALFLILENIDKKKYKPYVVYLNHTKYFNKTRKLNIKTYLYKDSVYTLGNNILLSKILNITNLFISKYFVFLSIYFEKIIHYPTNRFLNKIIKEKKIDLIHCNVQSARDLFILFSSIQNNIPMVSFIRSPKIDLMNSKKAEFMNKNISKIVPVSKSIGDLWEKAGIKSDKFFLIYDGINEFVPKKINLIKQLNTEKESIFIGCVARFVKGKGQELLIKAFKKLNNNDKKYKLVFLGTGPNLSKIKEQVIKLNLENEIFILGYKYNSLDYINSFDVNVLPSSIDVCSNVLLESLFCETFTIAHAAGGNPEIIIDNFNGFLFHNKDTNELKTKILMILNNRTKYSFFKTNGRKIIKEKFLIKKNIRKIENVYQKILI